MLVLLMPYTGANWRQLPVAQLVSGNLTRLLEKKWPGLPLVLKKTLYVKQHVSRGITVL